MNFHISPSTSHVRPTGAHDVASTTRATRKTTVVGAGTSPRRRSRVTATTALGVLLLAACGTDDTLSDASSGDEPSTAATTAPSPDSTDVPDTVADLPDATVGSVVEDTDRPSIDSLPSGPVTELLVTEIVAGEGPASIEGDTVVVDYTGVRSADGTEFDNSYDRGEPFAVGPLGSSSVIAGWDQGLLGVQAGQTLQLDIPNELAYGDQAQGDIIQAGDDLTFVIEVIAVIPGVTEGEAPEILSVEPTTGAVEVVSTDLVVGDGVEAVSGSNVAVQYLAFNGADGSMVDSGWSYNSPLVFTLGENTYIEGFDEGILGMSVGGRRQVVIPAELAFGVEGNPDLGIPAGADLVMVFDLLAIY